MKKGEMWLVEFPSTDSHEQSGTRPVIIISETEANIVLVIPLTSNLQALRFPHTLEIKPSKLNGLSAVSVGLAFQLRALDKKRLKTKIGTIEETILKRIDELLKTLLGL